MIERANWSIEKFCSDSGEDRKAFRKASNKCKDDFTLLLIHN